MTSYLENMNAFSDMENLIQDENDRAVDLSK